MASMPRRTQSSSWMMQNLHQVLYTAALPSSSQASLSGTSKAITASCLWLSCPPMRLLKNYYGNRPPTPMACSHTFTDRSTAAQSYGSLLTECILADSFRGIGQLPLHALQSEQGCQQALRFQPLNAHSLESPRCWLFAHVTNEL